MSESDISASGTQAKNLTRQATLQSALRPTSQSSETLREDVCLLVCWRVLPKMRHQFSSELTTPQNSRHHVMCAHVHAHCTKHCSRLSLEQHLFGSNVVQARPGESITHRHIVSTFRQMKLRAARGSISTLRIMTSRMLVNLTPMIKRLREAHQAVLFTRWRREVYVALSNAMQRMLSSCSQQVLNNKA